MTLANSSGRRRVRRHNRVPHILHDSDFHYTQHGLSIRHCLPKDPAFIRNEIINQYAPGETKKAKQWFEIHCLWYGIQFSPDATCKELEELLYMEMSKIPPPQIPDAILAKEQELKDRYNDVYSGGQPDIGVSSQQLHSSTPLHFGMMDAQESIENYAGDAEDIDESSAQALSSGPLFYHESHVQEFLDNPLAFCTLHFPEGHEAPGYCVVLRSIHPSQRASLSEACSDWRLYLRGASDAGGYYLAVIGKSVAGVNRVLEELLTAQNSST